MNATLALYCLFPSLLAGAGEIPNAVLRDAASRGPLVVQVHCGDGTDLVQLHQFGARVVQGLTDSAVQLVQTRATLHAKDIYGPISARMLSDGTLPYADNLVNAIVSHDLGDIAEQEVMRVLFPGGAAFVNGDGQWRTLIKPEPKEADDWTHYLHNADGNTLYAVDVADGAKDWHFTVGGRIDSPPTVHGGLVLFGSHDGWIYCLRASDGQLAWKYRAAPTDRSVMVRAQLESTWPVFGNVLVKNDITYFTAGRSSFLDGGVRLYALNATSGEVLHEVNLDGPWPDVSQDEGDCYGMDGAKSDILVTSGLAIHLGFNSFDEDLVPQPLKRPDKDGKRPLPMHLMPGNGFLDHTWYDRVAWSYDTTWQGRFYKWDRQPRSGQLLVFDDSCTYALKGYPQKTFMSPRFTPGEGYQLRADTNEILAQREYEKGKKWAVPSNVRAYGLVLAGETLFLAGSADLIPGDDPYRALDGRAGALLQAVSTTDGSVQTTLQLDAPPVFDGMIAAQSQLYIASEDGKVLCYAAPGGIVTAQEVSLQTP